MNVYQLFEAKADHIVREMFDSALRAGRYVLEDAGLSEYEAAELERIFYRHDRASLRELAELWRPGVAIDENADYVDRARALNAAMETALMGRFAAGPAAAPLDDGEDDEIPEHGLEARPGPGRPGGRF